MTKLLINTLRRLDALLWPNDADVDELARWRIRAANRVWRWTNQLGA